MNVFSDVTYCIADETLVVLIIQNDLLHSTSKKPETLVHVYIFINNRLKHVQNLYLNVNKIYLYSMYGDCFLLGLSDNDEITKESYIWEYDNFKKFREQLKISANKMLFNENNIVLVKHRVCTLIKKILNKQ